MNTEASARCELPTQRVAEKFVRTLDIPQQFLERFPWRWLQGWLLSEPLGEKLGLDVGLTVINSALTISARERELLILRVAVLTDAPYEWAHHRHIAVGAGVCEAELGQLQEGPEAADWIPRDAVLLRACDELVGRHRIGDATWKSLAEHYPPAQVVEIVAVVGWYVWNAMLINSLAIDLEDEVADQPPPWRDRSTP